MKSNYLAPFQETRKSYLISGPEGWQWGDFPVQGEYYFTLVWQDGKGVRSWYIKGLHIVIETQSYAYEHEMFNAYLFIFLKEKERINFPYYRLKIPSADSPDYPKGLKIKQKEDKIRLDYIKMAPELAHYLWPDTLEFSGVWEEKNPLNASCFKKTLSLITSNFINEKTEWNLPFTPLSWEGNTAKITQFVIYKTKDENAWRIYGIDQSVEVSKETGVWLIQEKDFISFKVIRPLEGNYFVTYSGKLFPNKLDLSLGFLAKRKNTKDLFEKHFSTYGLYLTNL